MASYTRRDRFYLAARRRGLKSRAAFKIEQLLDRFKLAVPGARIADLGCAPGGWMAILAAAAGPSGLVVGVDLQQCARAAANMITLVGDIRDPSIAGAIAQHLGGPADLLTSDLAPKLSGVPQRDEARSRELIDAAVDLATKCLRPGGAMVIKLFMGPDFHEVAALFKRRFGRVQIARTAATRPGSSELYIVGREFRGARGESLR